MSEKELLTRKDYQAAIDVQDACNLSGVVFSFAEIMERLCNTAHAEGHGTDWKNHHPIAVLFADKIAALAGTGDSSDSNYATAYHDTKKYLEDHGK